MKILAAAARVFRLYAIALWVGSLVFFVVVAAVAFGNLTSTHEAGIVVRHSLLALHRIGIVAGFVYIVFTPFFSLGATRQQIRLRVAEIGLAGIMLLLTMYSQWSIMPAMERDRDSLQQQYGTEVDQTPKSASAHADFDRLHSQSTHVEGTVLLAGLVVLALAVFPSRREDYNQLTQPAAWPYSRRAR